MGRVKMKYNKYNDVYPVVLGSRILLYKCYSNLLPETSMKDITKFIHCK